MATTFLADQCVRQGQDLILAACADISQHPAAIAAAGACPLDLVHTWGRSDEQEPDDAFLARATAQHAALCALQLPPVSKPLDLGALKLETVSDAQVSADVEKAQAEQAVASAAASSAEASP